VITTPTARNFKKKVRKETFSEKRKTVEKKWIVPEKKNLGKENSVASCRQNMAK